MRCYRVTSICTRQNIIHHSNIGIERFQDGSTAVGNVNIRAGADKKTIMQLYGCVGAGQSVGRGQVRVRRKSQVWT